MTMFRNFGRKEQNHEVFVLYCVLCMIPDLCARPCSLSPTKLRLCPSQVQALISILMLVQITDLASWQRQCQACNVCAHDPQKWLAKDRLPQQGLQGKEVGLAQKVKWLVGYLRR